MSFHDVSPPPFNSAVCISPPSATALPEISALALRRPKGSLLRERTDLFKRNEPAVIGNGYFVIRRCAVELRGFREDVREITMR